MNRNIELFLNQSTCEERWEDQEKLLNDVVVLREEFRRRLFKEPEPKWIAKGFCNMEFTNMRDELTEQEKQQIREQIFDPIGACLNSMLFEPFDDLKPALDEKLQELLDVDHRASIFVTKEDDTCVVRCFARRADAAEAFCRSYRLSTAVE